MTDYAIETLLKQYAIVKGSLTEWETKEYPSAKALREKRLRALSIALTKLGYDINLLQRQGATN